MSSMRVVWFAAGLLALLGCGVMRNQDPSPTPPPKGEGLESSPSPLGGGGGGWDPDALGRAAACLERGDATGAAGHLETYVCRHPDQIMFRVQLAELLIRVGQDAMAKAHYERFVADAQSATGPPRGHLVTAHTRLMEIAQR